MTHGAFDETQRDRLAVVLTEAACRAESVPDLAHARIRALVLIEEVAAGCFYSAGQPADDAAAGVFVDWQVSAGVLDGARKAQFAADLQDAAESAVGGGGRMVVTSCVIEEVPEGQWAQNGAIRRLPEVASIAGFEHLAAVATAG
ncbi:MAG: hypothetical protein HYZ39_13610 [Mycolicibacterium cosmeticum]|nr:hypothetical protein [Mycolicibacterium cosmeticum]